MNCFSDVVITNGWMLVIDVIKGQVFMVRGMAADVNPGWWLPVRFVFLYSTAVVFFI